MHEMHNRGLLNGILNGIIVTTVLWVAIGFIVWLILR
jgi:hypothetical protein